MTQKTLLFPLPFIRKASVGCDKGDPLTHNRELPLLLVRRPPLTFSFTASCQKYTAWPSFIYSFQRLIYSFQHVMRDPKATKPSLVCTGWSQGWKGLLMAVALLGNKTKTGLYLRIGIRACVAPRSVAFTPVSVYTLH